MRLRSLAPFFGVVLIACPGTDEPPDTPAGEACRYIGTVVGSDTEGSPASDCVYVGTANPLTGPLGAVGLALENAARLAVKDVNEAGGAGGKQLCLVACDTRTDPTTVEAAVNGIIDRYGIKALNGAAASSSSVEAAKATGPKSIAQISCCSTSPALSADPGVFRTVPSDALQGVVLASVARRLSPRAERVGVIYVNDTYGDSLKDVFVEAFGATGGTVTASAAYSPGQPSYHDVVSAVFASQPDHVALIAFPTDGAQIMRDWRTSGLGQSTRWLGTDGLKDNRFVLGAGSGTAARMTGTAPRLQGDHFEIFDMRYRAEYGGEAPGIFTSNQYDAVILIALGIARAGADASPGEIRDAIRAVAGGDNTAVPKSGPERLGELLTDAAAQMPMNYSGASGELDMDRNGDVLTDYGVWLVTGSEVADTEDVWTCALDAGRVGCNLR